MKYINREDIILEDYRLILDTETHHNHKIFMSDDVLYWEPNPDVQHFLKNISLNDLCPLLNCLGHGKNSEVYRKLYRDMGYSLCGYCEIFLDNNEDASDYIPNKI